MIVNNRKCKDFHLPGTKTRIIYHKSQKVHYMQIALLHGNRVVLNGGHPHVGGQRTLHDRNTNQRNKETAKIIGSIHKLNC